jgi:rubredoxin
MIDVVINKRRSGMKAKDILRREEIPDDTCGVCMLHDMAYDVLDDNILCPICGAVLSDSILGYDGFNVVGETNEYNENEEINKYQILDCNNCGGIFSLMPTKIIYNGNHDIFYTGGRRYLADNTDAMEKRVREAILPSIEQYTNRLKNGEHLEPYQLAWWIQGDIDQAVAAFLYENGYKK